MFRLPLSCTNLSATSVHPSGISSTGRTAGREAKVTLAVVSEMKDKFQFIVLSYYLMIKLEVNYGKLTI